MSTRTPAVDDFLLCGSAGKSAFAKDDAVGTTVTGVIIGTEVHQQADIKDGTPLVWENGDPHMQLVVSLQNDPRCGAEDNGCRALYVKGSKTPRSKSLHDAVRAAVQEVGVKGIEVAGSPTVAVATPAPAVAAAPAPVLAVTVAPDAESPAYKAKQLIALGFDDNAVVAILRTAA